MDISAKHMLRKARDADNLSRLVASEAHFFLHRCEPRVSRSDPWEQEPIRAEHRREEAPAAWHVLARQPPAHKRALPAEHTGGEGMSGYNPYTEVERHRRAQPRREAIRGADMARCAVITFAAVLMLLGAWILM